MGFVRYGRRWVWGGRRGERDSSLKESSKFPYSSRVCAFTFALCSSLDKSNVARIGWECTVSVGMPRIVNKGCKYGLDEYRVHPSNSAII